MKRLFLFLAFILVISPAFANCSDDKIDINAAPLEELDKLSGIGPAYAQRIIDTRPFSSIDELTKVSGIGPATLEKIKQQGLACVLTETTQEETENQSQNTTQSLSDQQSSADEDSKTIALTPTKIDLNTAAVKELEKIKWIGAATAQLIIKARPLYSLDDLTKIKGITESKLQDIKAQGLAYVEEQEQPETEEIEEEQNTTITEPLSVTLKQPTENIIKLDKQIKEEETITGKVIYESKTEKIRKYAIYAFSILLIVILFLILKH